MMFLVKFPQKIWRSIWTQYFRLLKEKKTRSSSYWKKLRPLINQARLQDIERTHQQVKARKALKERERKEREKESKKRRAKPQKKRLHQNK